MKDIYNRELNVGDTVVILYHPDTYVFSLEKAVIDSIEKNYLYVVLNDGSKRSYKKNENDIVTRVLKVTPFTEDNEYNGPKDAIGQPLEIGDLMAFQKPNELGNTCKGFENGGHIVKFTAEYAFYESETDNKQHRKKFNRVIKITQ